MIFDIKSKRKEYIIPNIHMSSRFIRWIYCNNIPIDNCHRSQKINDIVNQSKSDLFFSQNLASLRVIRQGMVISYGTPPTPCCETFLKKSENVSNISPMSYFEAHKVLETE